MNWNLYYIVAFGGAAILLFVIVRLALLRFGILIKAEDKQAAMRQSIEQSWLHKLGGGGASKRSLWIMTALACVSVLYKVANVHTFDFLALLDSLVTGSLVFVLANGVRLALLYFQPNQANGAISSISSRSLSPNSNNTPQQFWLLAGDTPVGPFRSDEILSKIQDGSCTWTTRACLVGSNTWSPLNQLWTQAPVAALADETVAQDDCASTNVSTAALPVVSPSNSTSPNHLVKVVGILVLALVGYWLYSSYIAEPLSPQQVCRALNSAKSAQEAKNFVTPNMYAALGVLFTQTDDSDDGSLEVTTEQPASSEVGGVYVGFQVHLRAEKPPIMMHGVFHLLNQPGWKVNDMILLSLNRQSIDPPISVAREYEFFRDPQHPVVTQRQSTDAKMQAQQWHTNSLARNTTRFATSVVAKSSIGKWMASVIGVILVGLYGLFHKQKATASTSDPGQKDPSR